MFQITINNEKQQTRFDYDGGTLRMGRNAPDGAGFVTIDDPFVSRQHIQVELVGDDKLRIENTGQNHITLINGKHITRGESRDLVPPIRLTIGKSVIEISFASGDSAHQTGTLEVDARGIPDLGAIMREKIGKYYHYPLAYGYSLLETFTNSADRYREQLRVAENLLAFLGSLSVALLDKDQIRQLDQGLGRSALTSWQGGISPGHWLDLMIHALNQLADVENEPLYQGLVRLDVKKDKRGFGKILRDLIKAKNDFKHDRGPSIHSEYKEQGEFIDGHLRKAYEYLSFLPEHPMRLVQEINPRRRSEESDVIFLKCMGNHPGFATEVGVHSQRLRKGDLYIELAPGRLSPLYPFIHATTCRQCKAREFFFIDRVTQKGAAGLKSFDRGHTEEDEDIGRELQAAFAVD